MGLTNPWIYLCLNPKAFTTTTTTTTMETGKASGKILLKVVTPKQLLASEIQKQTIYGQLTITN